jgi:organic hydroperoxide reductase OsmC/OhrA
MKLGCFLGALQAVAAQRGVRDAAKDAKIKVSVHLGEPTDKVSYCRMLH